MEKKEEKFYNLKLEIKSLGMTQKDFAKHIDKSVYTITKWVKNDIEVPKVIKLYIETYKKAKILDQLSLK